LVKGLPIQVDKEKQKDVLGELCRSLPGSYLGETWLAGEMRKAYWKQGVQPDHGPA
jgi:hypothetical protein